MSQKSYSLHYTLPIEHPSTSTQPELDKFPSWSYQVETIAHPASTGFQTQLLAIKFELFECSLFKVTILLDCAP